MLTFQYTKRHFTCDRPGRCFRFLYIYACIAVFFGLLQLLGELRLIFVHFIHFVGRSIIIHIEVICPAQCSNCTGIESVPKIIVNDNKFVCHYNQHFADVKPLQFLSAV